MSSFSSRRMDRDMVLIFLLIIYLFPSCCEPPHIDNLSVCNNAPIDLGHPPTCGYNYDAILNKGEVISVSINTYNISSDSEVEFSLYDRSRDLALIEKVMGLLSEFGSAYSSTERCAFGAAYTFDMPLDSVWPPALFVEVIVENNPEYILRLSFSTE